MKRKTELNNPAPKQLKFTHSVIPNSDFELELRDRKRIKKLHKLGSILKYKDVPIGGPFPTK